MPKAVLRHEVRELLGDGVPLVEVPPREEYEEAHLPGAINMPLKELDREGPVGLLRAGTCR